MLILIIEFLKTNLETIKNALFSLVSIIAFIGLIFFTSKFILYTYKIDKINKKIEKAQTELDEEEINNIKGEWAINIIDDVGQKKYKRKLEQDIQRLNREKKYLLEEISIFKIFKK